MPKQSSISLRRLGAGSNVAIDRDDPDYKAKALMWEAPRHNTKKKPEELGPYDVVINCWDKYPTPTVPTEETFETMLYAYNIAKKSTGKELGEVQAPVEIRIVGNRRGLFATQAIPKGSKIYKADDAIGYAFYALVSYKRFLTYLEPELQCEALQWSYPEDGVLYVSIGEDAVVHPASNIQQMNAKEEDGSSTLIATRGIQAGEEILKAPEERNYERIEWFQDLREEAWGRESEKKQKATNTPKAHKSFEENASTTTGTVSKKVTINSSKLDFTLHNNNAEDREVSMQESAVIILPRHMMIQFASFVILCLLWSVPYLRRRLRSKMSTRYEL